MTCAAMREQTAKEIQQLRAEVASLRAKLGASTVNSDASEIKADVLELAKQVKAIRDVLATGKSRTQSVTFGKDSADETIDTETKKLINLQAKMFGEETPYDDPIQQALEHPSFQRLAGKWV